MNFNCNYDNYLHNECHIFDCYHMLLENYTILPYGDKTDVQVFFFL